MRFTSAICAVAALLLSNTQELLAARRVHIYTFSDTLPHPGLCTLAEAANELGDTFLRVFGTSKRPGFILVHSHSPTLKFLMLQEVIEYELSLGRIREDDLLIFVDGHDVFLQRPIKEIVEAYERWPDSPYLLSGEKNCWPWPHTAPGHGEWDPGMAVDENRTWRIHDNLHLSTSDFCRVVYNGRQGPYPFLNIGTSIGPVSKVLEVMKRNNRIVQEEDVNDQGAMWLILFRYAQELNIQVDQRAAVFMNMLEYEPGELEREPCAPGWLVNRSTPRNRLTNTAPGLMHFNGPSHEDEVWPQCFHASHQAWRAEGRGHAFFDVDHNLLVSTDAICDYSFYHVNSYHAHPVNAGTLRFLENLLQLPVDPGLLAWRNTSAVDVTRQGKADALHISSPLVFQALNPKGA